jgi:3',5'-nucleoside bisphosphate phosphatase
LIDLHLHTTSSDGTLGPSALVARVAGAGITVFSVTDHDTIAGLEEARAAAAARGLRLVNGIEITAVEHGRDVHVLGYFIDPSNVVLGGFLDSQRADRLRRVRAMTARLAALGCPIDGDALVRSNAAHPGRSIGRPAIADALVAAGHARDRDDAFDRFLGSGSPAFVPRVGSPPEQVIAIINQAGGLASLAHPGLLKMDAIIPRLAAAGLTALEVRHSDHSPETEQHYRQLAGQHGLAVSGGSDFHGDGGHRIGTLGAVTLPAAEFARLESRLP